MKSTVLKRAFEAALLACVAVSCSSSTASEQSSIDSRAAEVMPFDLELTTHSFTKDADGGVETVLANDPADADQIGLIQDHLADEAQSFSRGDYPDPAEIHSMDMPGIKELQDGANRIDVRYADLPGGGTITYRSAEPNLVAALHAWFDRQTTDHG